MTLVRMVSVNMQAMKPKQCAETRCIYPSYTAPSSSFQTIPFLRGREHQSAYTARLYWDC